MLLCSIRPLGRFAGLLHQYVERCKAELRYVKHDMDPFAFLPVATMSSRPGKLESRRRFLAGGLCSLASCLPVARSLGSEPDGLEWWLREIAAQLPAAAALGRQYLEQRPDEASADWLARALFGEFRTLDEALGCRQFFRQCMATGCTADYRDGRLVVLDGWALPQSDARLLALLALRDY